MKKKPHGCDLRRGRASLPGQLYLVTTVTNERRPIFNNFHAGRVLVQEIMRPGNYGWTDTLAFVVMPDHLHWLVSIETSIPLSSVVGTIKRHSARKINDLVGSRGSPVWQRGFHDHALRRDEDAVHVARYIVANPLRARLVSRIGDYPLWDAAWL
ncbi:MAG: transposase [Gammaproteobacteria bacterium]